MGIGTMISSMVVISPPSVSTSLPVSAIASEPTAPTYFCGDYLTGLNTGAALASGWFCAEKITSP